MMGGSGISWTICKSFSPCSRQITMPTPHQSIFTGFMLFLIQTNSVKILKAKTLKAKRHVDKPNLNSNITRKSVVGMK